MVWDMGVDGGGFIPPDPILLGTSALTERLGVDGVWTSPLMLCAGNKPPFSATFLASIRDLSL